MPSRELMAIPNEAVMANRPNEGAQAGLGHNRNPTSSSNSGDAGIRLKDQLRRLRRRLKHRTEVNVILEKTITSLEEANTSLESAITNLDETNGILEESITSLEGELSVAAHEQQKTKALLDKVVLVVNTLGNTEVQSAVEVTMELGSCY